MKRLVDVLYGIKGYPNAARFTTFKTDFFANGSTPGITMDTATTNGVSVTAATTTAIRVTAAATTGLLLSSTASNGVSITGVCSTSALSVSSASAIGLSLSGAFTTAAIDITGTAGRGIRIGTKGKVNDGSLPITATLPFDTDPANNYLLGVFSKIATTAVSATDDLGSAWFRTRVNKAMATNAGYSLWGAKSQLRIYADTGTGTTISNWAAAGLMGVLEVSGATTTFASGCVAAAGYFNCALATTTVISSGAVVAGVAINNNVTATGITTNASLYGLYIGQYTAGLLDFDCGIKIASGSCLTGVDVTISALPAGDTYSGIRSVVTAAAPNNSYGCAGYFETNTTGTAPSNFVYGFGSWVNMVSGVAKAGGYLCAQDNGIYYVAGTLTSARVIFGLRAEIPVSMAAAGRVCMFSMNTNNVPITALFDIVNWSDLAPAASKSSTSLYVPIAIDDGGAKYYVLIYT